MNILNNALVMIPTKTSGLELDVTVQAITKLIAKYQAEGDERMDCNYEELSEAAQLQIILGMLMRKLDGLQV